MWIPLTPAEVVAAMGAPARAAARAPERLAEWERAQLLSVYSASRHLAAELAGVEPHTPAVAAELAAVLRAGRPRWRRSPASWTPRRTHGRSPTPPAARSTSCASPGTTRREPRSAGSSPPPCATR